MKFGKFVMTIAAAVLVAGTAFAQGNKVELKTQTDSLAYIWGMELSGFFGEDAKNLNMEAMKAGAIDALEGNNQMQNADVNALVKSYQDKKANVLKEKGEKFLAENAKKEGVVTTASGLQYEVITEGQGAQPAATDEVTVHYHGTFIDGNVFDSSVERGTPSTFPLNGVIKGWTEGVQLMKVGSKYRFFIKPELAYGPQGRQGIPPHSVLIFEVELISITEKEMPKPTE
jgi:FKBP-type peptidyl-prolyl cis-trans isomerase